MVASVFHEADALHRKRDLGVLHEPAPDVPGAHVFGAQEDDAGVDSDHVSIDPARFGIERVYEAILPVNLCAVLLIHGPQRAR